MTLFQSQIGAIEEIATKVTSSTVAVIVDGTSPDTQAWLVPWMQVNENAGSTPNLTVELYDGTSSYYLGSGGSSWVAKAVTAKQSVEFTNVVVPSGWKLRVTSSDAAGKFDVVGTKTRRVR